MSLSDDIERYLTTRVGRGSYSTYRSHLRPWRGLEDPISADDCDTLIFQWLGEYSGREVEHRVRIFRQMWRAMRGSSTPVDAYFRPPPALISVCNPRIRQQLARILSSMREFPFQPGGHWQTPVGAGGLEEGYTYRCGGDPIHHTIGEVAGEYATRAQTIEALQAVMDRRPARLSPRLQALVPACVTVATALHKGRRLIQTDGGSVRVRGPILPPTWAAKQETTSCAA